MTNLPMNENNKQVTETIDSLNRVFRHAEDVGQARLNNFLMTGTILLVGCGVALQAENEFVGACISLSLSIIGIYFSRAWYYLGRRQRKFHIYVETHLDYLVDCDSIENEHLVTNLIREFQKEEIKTSGMDPTTVEINFSSRRMLTYVPRMFFRVYIVTATLSIYAAVASPLFCDMVNLNTIAFLLVATLGALYVLSWLNGQYDMTSTDRLSLGTLYSGSNGRPKVSEKDCEMLSKRYPTELQAHIQNRAEKNDSAR